MDFNTIYSRYVDELVATETHFWLYNNTKYWYEDFAVTKAPFYKIPNDVVDVIDNIKNIIKLHGYPLNLGIRFLRKEDVNYDVDGNHIDLFDWIIFMEEYEQILRNVHNIKYLVNCNTSSDYYGYIMIHTQNHNRFRLQIKYTNINQFLVDLQEWIIYKPIESFYFRDVTINLDKEYFCFGDIMIKRLLRVNMLTLRILFENKHLLKEFPFTFSCIDNYITNKSCYQELPVASFLNWIIRFKN